MKTKFKKGLALLLAVIMIAGTVPVSAMADEGPAGQGSSNTIGPVGGPEEPAPALSALSEKIKAYSDVVFAPGGEYSNLGTVYVDGPRKEGGASGEYYAGETVKYAINYDMKTAPVWSEGYEGAQTLMDRYNIQLKFTLPEGLKLIELPGFDVTWTDNEDGTRTYTGVIEKSPDAANYKVTMSVYVSGNGTDKSIATYPGLKVDMDTSFTVLNKEQEPYEEVAEYTLNATSTSAGFSTTTKDEWDVQKDTIGDVVLEKNSAGKDVAKVTYRIVAGMKNESGGQQKEVGQFQGVGRTAIESMSMYDVLVNEETVFIDNSTGAPVESPFAGSAISATIKKVSRDEQGNVVYGDPVTIDTTGDGKLVIVADEKKGEVAEEDLALETTELMYDHNYEDGPNIFVKREDVPSVTEYQVEAKYELKDGAIAEFNKPNNEVKFRNDVKLVSKLAGKDKEDENKDDAKAEMVLPKKGNASFSISKSLKDYNGGTAPYKGEYGQISYVLKYKSGEGTPAVYGKADGTEPVEGALEAGKTYYIVPGMEYVVEELLTAEQAAAMKLLGIEYTKGETNGTEGFNPAAGENWSVAVSNEEKAADITVNKKDDNGSALAGAEFTLYSSTDAGKTWTEFKKETTTGSGTAIFVKVPYGEYKIEETKTPFGYTGAFASGTFTVSSNTDLEFNATNDKTTATIQLTKRLGTAEADADMRVATNFGDKASFTLERRKQGTETWETVTYDVDGNAIATAVDGTTGQIRATVAAYVEENKDGTVVKVPYEYRFREQIAAEAQAEIYNPYGGTDTTQGVSDIVTLFDSEKQIALRNTVDVDMYNRRKVQISIAKKFYDVDGGAFAENEDLTTKVTLYTYDGTTMTAVSEQTAGGETAAVWSGLELYSGSTKKSFYVSEEDVTGYALDIAKSEAGETVEIDGKIYIPVVVTGVETDKTLYNIQQQIPVTIYKKNYYTKAFVEGAGVTVYAGDVAEASIAYDAKTATKKLEKQMITSKSGLTVYLAPGSVYKVVETVNGTGLTRQNATEDKPLEIDLSEVKQAYGETAVSRSVTVYNKPDPEITITKLSNPTTSVTADKNKLKTSEFTVYTKNADDTYSPVLSGGNEIKIKGTGAKSGVRLKAGTYYLLETNVPDGWIDPDVMPGQYPNCVRGTSTKDSLEHSFFELTVRDATWTETGTADNTFSTSITNVRNAGKLQVYKYIDGKSAKVAGFIIRATGNNSETNTQTKTTSASYAYVTFSNLPVYDSEGNLIEYTITEDEITKSLSGTYCKSANCDGQVATLQLNKTTSKDTSGKTLIVRNETLVKVRATKLRINTWEHDFTGIAYLMGGVTLGLYQKETTAGAEGGEDTVVWKLIDEAETGGWGTAEFDKSLRRDGEYAVVEVDCPDNYNMFPQGGKKYARDENREALKEIPAGELEQYNVLRVGADKIATATVSNNYTVSAGELINMNHWLQFDITKWQDKDKLGSKYTDEQGNEQELTKDSVVEIDKDEDKPLDNAVFELYKRSMRDNETEANFEYTTALESGWSLEGTYTSGTKYGPDGKRVPGGFVTGIQQGVDDSYVYVLVEKSAGPTGAKRYNYYKYTFYSAGTVNEAGETVLKYSSNIPRQQMYELDRKNEDDILNATPSGTGEDYVMLTSIRLSKWADMYDKDGQGNEVKWLDVYNPDGTFRADGPFGGKYVPLPNAKFEVRLKDDPSVVIAELTSGLDASKPNEMKFGVDRAWAQSGIYGLKVTENEDGTLTGTLIDYQTEETAGDEDKVYKSITGIPVTVMNEDTKEADGCTIYGILTQVAEIEAPEGYSYAGITGEMYLCFVEKKDQDTWYFNDAYFVKTDGVSDAPLSTEQTTPTWYITNANAASSTEASGSFGTGPQYRIVDYRIHNTTVMLYKYGYTPGANTIGKTGQDLDKMGDGEIGRTPLRGVRMKITGDNGYSKEFETGENGLYIFPDGLEPGTYTVTELGGSGDYENSYGAAGQKKVFTITEDMEKLRVSMYNPLRSGITVTKEDTLGNALSGVNITIGDNTVPTSEGKAEFGKMESGTYAFSESTSAYSIQYLYEYLNGKYPGLVTLSADGRPVQVNIGLTYGTATETIVSTGRPNFGGTGGRREASSVGTDVVVTAINGTTEGELCVPDPEIKLVNPVLSDLGLVKHDSENDAAAVAGAKFEVKYLRFDKWSGEVSTDGSWTAVKSGESDGLWVTDADGRISLTDKEPGIYSFRETEAPSGYEIIKDINGDEIIYYVVLTGGMPVSIAEGALPAAAGYYGVEGNEHTVKTLFMDDTAEFKAVNRKTVKAYAAKTVTKGELDKELTWKVTLNLKDSAGNTAGSAVISQATEGKVPFKKDGRTTELSFGNPYAAEGDEPAYTKYYLEEVLPEGGNYSIAKVTVGEGESKRELTAETEGKFAGMYAISVTDLSDISIEVTNRYMRGEVLFAKRDSETRTVTLSGAQFKVCVKDGDEWIDLSDCTVTELKDAKNVLTGIYKADIHLVDAAEHTYGIFETVAPEHYLTNPELHIEADLSAENNSEDFSGDMDKLLNTQGVTIDILKYDNVHGAAAKEPAPAKSGEASFLLLKKTAGGSWEIAPTVEVTVGEDGKVTYTQVTSGKSIGTDGKVRYDVDPGKTYGFIEYSYDTSKYAGTDSVYYVNGSAVAEDGTYTVDGVARTVYTLGELGYGAEDIHVAVYNVPLLKAKIVKKDIGNYPQNVIPQAKFTIYDVTAKDTADGVFVPTSENVLTLGEDADVVKVLTGDTTEADGNTTYYEWAGRDPGRHYVVVETKVKSHSGDTYDTLNKDYKGVVWYRNIPAVTDPNPGVVDVFTLDNVYSDAKVELDKKIIVNGEEADSSRAESLLKTGCEAEYILKPGAESHNQALHSFRISDSGLSFEQESKSEEYKGCVPGYSIEKVKIGSASHTLGQFASSVSSGNITVKCTFYSEPGCTGDVKGVQTEDVSVDCEIAAPAGTKSFMIEYYSEGVRTATQYVEAVEAEDETEEGTPGHGYSLGYDFTPGEIRVYVKVDKLGDNGEEPTAEVKSFTNRADTELTYPKWDDEGKGTSIEKKTASDTVKTEVGSILLPIAYVEKGGESGQEGNQSVATYTITVKNNGDSELVNPIVLDTLPTGVAYRRNSVKGGQIENGPSIVRSCDYVIEEEMYTGEATLKDGDTIIGEAETGVVFKLNGCRLAAGESTTIEFEAEISDSAVIYGDMLQNFVYLSSGEKGYRTEANPNGYPFAVGGQPGMYDFGTDLENAAKDMSENIKKGSPASVRERALSKVLAEHTPYESGSYEWVKAWHEMPSDAKNGLTVKKAVWGDKDSGFRDADSFLGHATRTNMSPSVEQPGWVDYRLTVFNGGESEKRSHMTVGDVLPSYNHKDGRDSRWDSVMSRITSVTLNGAETSKYTVYYYCGEGAKAALAAAQGATVTAEGERTDWTEYKAGLEASGWTPAPEDITAATAFLIVFDADQTLDINGYIVVTYHTTTEDIQSDEVFAERAAFQNANNTFIFTFVEKQGGRYVVKDPESNTVKTTLMDREVSIEGDVWIDEDWDSEQQGPASERGARDYSGYAIIDKLKSAISVELRDERQAPDPKHIVKVTDEEALAERWDEVGESIKHFAFDKLGASSLKNNVTEDGAYVNETLNTKALKTTDPYNYSLRATVSGDDAEELKSIFKLTEAGVNHYRSDNLSEVKFGDKNDPKANELDSNFNGADGTYVTTPFFIRYSDVIDNSKDIGFRMYRDLEIFKTDLSGSSEIEGAEFSIYGPFEEGTLAGLTTKEALEELCTADKLCHFTAETEGAEESEAAEGEEAEEKVTGYVLDDEGSETTLVTGEDGKIKVKDLNWWKEYIIRETKAAEGYTIGKATAEGTEDTGVTELPEEGYWGLEIPGPGKTEKLDTVTVKNLSVGKIRIVKTLENWKPGTPDAKFVFSVTVYEKNKETEEEEITYSDVLTLNFSGPGTQAIEVDELPIGSKVVVKEIYSGAEYELTTGEQEQTIEHLPPWNDEYDEETEEAPEDPEAKPIFYFGNRRTYRKVISGGVVNEFENNEGNWEWNKVENQSHNEGPVHARDPEETGTKEDEGQE